MLHGGSFLRYFLQTFFWYTNSIAFAVWLGFGVSKETWSYKVRAVDVYRSRHSFYKERHTGYLSLVTGYFFCVLLNCACFFQGLILKCIWNTNSHTPIQGLPPGNVQNYCAETPPWHCIFPSSWRGVFKDEQYCRLWWNQHYKIMTMCFNVPRRTCITF